MEMKMMMAMVWVLKDRRDSICVSAFIAYSTFYTIHGQRLNERTYLRTMERECNHWQWSPFFFFFFLKYFPRSCWVFHSCKEKKISFFKNLFLEPHWCLQWLRITFIPIVMRYVKQRIWINKKRTPKADLE